MSSRANSLNPGWLSCACIPFTVNGSVAGDFKAWTRAIAEATGRKGARLFMPLRSALTGATHGPELAPLVGLMGTARVLGRLERAQALAGK